MTVQLADSHAHLQETDFDRDRDSVIENALSLGISLIMVPGVDLASSQAAIGLSDRYPRLVAAAGYHPHEAEHYGSEDARGVEDLLSGGRVAAVGEIGLDYYRMLSPRETQLLVFEAMLDLAEAASLPIIVHTRDAEEDMLGKLTAWSLRAGRKMEPPFGVMHYFSGDLDRALRYFELGFMISMHTSVTHPKSSTMREVAGGVPLEALVLETDAPYGAPQARRGSRNEPVFLEESAAMIASLRGCSLEELGEVTTTNAFRLFRVPAPVREEALS